MQKRLGFQALLWGATLCMAAFPLAAEPAAPPAAAPQSTVAGWDDLIDGLSTLPDRLLAKLPEDMRNDPQVRQEVARLALESLASSAIDALGGDPDHPEFLPSIGQLLNIGQPNSDTIYRMARVNPAGTYRLRGRQGSITIASIGQAGPTPYEPGSTSGKPGPTRSYLNLSTLHTDADGRFDVILSPTRPEGYDGDWWQMLPNTNKLLLRLVSSDWGKEQDPTISIERMDIPVNKPRTPADDLERRLRQLPRATEFMAALFVDHVAQLREQGYVNKLKILDVSQIGGLTGQFYYEGAYDLHPDEALIIEAKHPAKCLYRSVILTNEIYETTDALNNYSSLNGAQAKADKDGVLRIVVSAKDPGVPNWLDTAGYPFGVVQGRWTGCDSQPVPSVRKVKIDEVRAMLPADTPAVTPEQRQTEIRERRAAFQQRPHW